MAKLKVKISDENNEFRFDENLPNPFSGLHEAQRKLREAVENTKPLMHDFHKALHPLFTSLVEKGWYINAAGYIDELVKLKTLINSSDLEGINNLMIEQIDSTYESLKGQTQEIFSSKKEILQRAFKAFESDQYEYAILLFLTQTDSICNHLTGTRLFGRDKKLAKTKKFADERFDPTSFASAVIQPLAEIGEINKAELEYTPGEFNRHRIIRGEDVDFASKLNMYKMLSLIFYLTTIVSRAKKDNVPGEAV